jgi:hypothetical protein
MDFLKGMLGADAKSQGEKDGIADALNTGKQAAVEAHAVLLRRSQEYADKGQYFLASLVVFVGAWALVGGIGNHLKQWGKFRAKGSPVAKLWNICRLAFTSEDDATAVAAMTKLVKDWKDEQDDD